jgi:methylmalonyl-CoA mutase, N-terminal domain
LRTQQIIAFESGVVDTVDPMGGSYFVEALTDEVEAAAWKYIERIDTMGGAVSAIEQGYMQQEIAAASYAYQTAIERNEKIIVGVNKFQGNDGIAPHPFKIDDSIRQIQTAKLNQLKNERDNEAVKKHLAQLEQNAKDGTNVMPNIIDSVEAYATLGEVADVLRGVFREYKA